MIKNEREYRITRAQAEKFAGALKELESQAVTTGVQPQLLDLQIRSIRSEIAELIAQITEYEALRSGDQRILELDSFEDLPIALIKARIAAGLNQKELAQRLGLKEQQIQRYEATNYETASLARLKEVVRALELHIREDVFLPNAQISVTRLLDRLIEAGLKEELIVRRLLPAELVARLQSGQSESEGIDSLVLKTANIIGSMFGWTAAAIFGNSPLLIRTDLATLARYKVRATAQEKYLLQYTTYAFALAQLSLKASRQLTTRMIPTDAKQVHSEIVESYGSVTFEHTLEYIWDLGIPILPLNDPGAFNGACWREEGRNIIILKQVTSSPDQELFNLLHEVGHARQEPEREQFAVLETGSSISDRWNSEDEVSASRFAIDVLLRGRAEELVEICVKEANGIVERLKAVVPRVARSEGVATGVLANYLAYRLSLQDINWWGAAANLQLFGSPLDVARRLFLQRIELSNLSEQERSLLRQSLSDVA